MASDGDRKHQNGVVFVKNLDETVDERKLVEEFCQFGKILCTKVNFIDFY